MVVFAISLTVAKLLAVDHCHFVTAPVFPLSESVVVLVPVHTVAEPSTVPPTDTGLTVTVT